MVTIAVQVIGGLSDNADATAAKKDAQNMDSVSLANPTDSENQRRAA